MKNKNLFIPVIVGLALVIGGYYGVQALGSDNNVQLKAFGTIETVNVDLSPEVTGRVKQVWVDEGQVVKAGQALFVLDDTLLQEQRKVLVAGLGLAQAASQSMQNSLSIARAQYQITLEAALAQDKQARLSDWFSKDPKQFDQPSWYFTRAEQTQTAQAQVDEAKKTLDEAQSKLTDITQSLAEADFPGAEQRLQNARLAYIIAKNVNNQAQNSATRDTPKGLYNRTHCGTNQGYFVENARLTNLIYKCSGDKNLGNAGRTLYDAARAELEDAQKTHNELLTSKAANEVLQARADVSVAQERYYSALDFLRNLQTGDQSPEVIVAQGTVDQAQAAYDQSQKAVAQAQANLELLDAQRNKLTVYAPMDGVILTRSIEPGEFIQPGLAALTMGNINALTITVYVPEDRYGQIYLGQKASVVVDSFPSQQFNAQVGYISNQAEFTPRNVQTVEGRASTVYAVKLTVVDPQGKLKPGMPADVTFAP